MLKLIILKNNLIDGLNVVGRAIGDNVNLPILKSVLFKADNKINLTSTNLELAANCFIPGKIIEPGEITVPFNVFSSVISNLNSERITLEQKDKRLFVSTDNYEAAIQSQNSKDFPIIPSVKNKNQSLKTKINQFKESLSQVVIASQYSDVRPEISGVFLRFQEKELILVATDSFRLAEKKMGSDKISSSFSGVNVIIPLKTAQEVLKIFSNQEEEVEIFMDSNQIFFNSGSRELTSRLIDGTFPDYELIIPKQTQSEAILNREEMINAVKLTSSFSGRANDVVLKIGDNKKFLEIFSSDSALGENRYRIPVKLKGERFSVAFNWRYLLDGLRINSGEEATLGVNASDKPVVIKSAGEPFLNYVVMPIKN